MQVKSVLIVVIQIGWMSAACAAGPADDAKAVAQCIEKAEKNDQFPGACIGVIADPCIKNASSPDDAKACAKRELAVWRARLTKAVAAIGKSGPKQMPRRRLGRADRDSFFVTKHSLDRFQL